MILQGIDFASYEGYAAALYSISIVGVLLGGAVWLWLRPEKLVKAAGEGAQAELKERYPTEEVTIVCEMPTSPTSIYKK